MSSLGIRNTYKIEIMIYEDDLLRELDCVYVYMKIKNKDKVIKHSKIMQLENISKLLNKLKVYKIVKNTDISDGMSVYVLYAYEKGSEIYV